MTESLSAFAGLTRSCEEQLVARYDAEILSVTLRNQHLAVGTR